MSSEVADFQRCGVNSPLMLSVEVHRAFLILSGALLTRLPRHFTSPLPPCPAPHARDARQIRNISPSTQTRCVQDTSSHQASCNGCHNICGCSFQKAEAQHPTIAIQLSYSTEIDHQKDC
jgi:hypothetical protein